MSSRFDPVPPGSAPRQTSPVPCDLGQLHELFIQHRRYQKSASDETVVWHKRALTSYYKAGCSGLPTQPMIDQFIERTRERGVKPVSVNTWLRSLKAFSIWLVENGHMTIRPRFPKVPTPRKLLVVYTDAQWSALMNAKCERRLHMLIAMISDSGMRISETLRMRWDQVLWDEMVYDLHGKGALERRVAFSPKIRAVLHRYQQRKWPLLGYSQLVFPTRNDTAWSKRAALKEFHRLSKRLGVPRCGFHRLRHTFATDWLRRHKASRYALKLLSQMLGHSSVTTTERYLHLLDDDMREAQQYASAYTRLGR